MTLRLPNLEIDLGAGGPDDEIMLTQDIGGNTSMVSLHPAQVCLLAERLGLLSPAGHADADRVIARLSRQLCTLHDRIEHLDEWLHELSDTAHADLSYEQTYSQCTWELAREFLRDLPDLGETGTASDSSQSSPRQRRSAVDRAERLDGQLPLVAVDGQPLSSSCAADGAARSRVQRHRQRRAGMLEALRAKGVDIRWDVPMPELQRLHAQHCNTPPAKPCTGQPATAPATPAMEAAT